MEFLCRTAHAELEAIACERAAMQALNCEREHNGLAQAYGEEAFFELGKRADNIADALRSGMAMYLEGQS